jgi:hypothetical protein
MDLICVSTQKLTISPSEYHHQNQNPNMTLESITEKSCESANQTARNGTLTWNQSAKAEILAGPVGNKVGIGRGPEVNWKEGACQTWPGEKSTAREWLEGTALYRDPRVLASRSPDIREMR